MPFATRSRDQVCLGSVHSARVWSSWKRHCWIPFSYSPPLAGDYDTRLLPRRCVLWGIASFVAVQMHFGVPFSGQARVILRAGLLRAVQRHIRIGGDGKDKDKDKAAPSQENKVRRLSSFHKRDFLCQIRSLVCRSLFCSFPCVEPIIYA